MALPLTASQKDVFEDKLREAEAEIQKIRKLALSNSTGAAAAINTAVTAAKAAIDAADKRRAAGSRPQAPEEASAPTIVLQTETGSLKRARINASARS